MQVRIKSVTIPSGRRVIAVSDIHGEGALLDALLEKAGFCDEDTLILVGDYVEKGGHSLATLRRVMELARGENVYALLGNNDPWFLIMLEGLNEENAQPIVDRYLQQIDWFGGCLLLDMATELGIDIRTGADLLRHRDRLLDAFRPEWDFIASMPTVLSAGRYIFVHGGLPHEDLDRLERDDPYRYMKYDHFRDEGICFDRYLVVGHWPACLYRSEYDCQDPHIDRQQHIISIDGGCALKKQGQLNALIIPDIMGEDVSHIMCDGLPSAVALDDQTASNDPFFIRYGDNDIRILEAGEDTCLVEHVRTGRQMRIPASFVDVENCWLYYDVSDYRLPVRAGDTLAVVVRTDQGCYAKVGGLCGWYMGRLT